MLNIILVILITLIAAAVTAFAQYLFKRNVKKFGFNIREIILMLKNRNTLIGLILYVISLLLYLYALHEAPVISFVYPLFASSLVFVLLISKLILKESMHLHRIIGILFIAVGIALIAMTLT